MVVRWRAGELARSVPRYKKVGWLDDPQVLLLKPKPN